MTARILQLGVIPPRKVCSGAQGGLRADIFERGPGLTERQLLRESDSSDGIIGNMKIDNYGRRGSYLSRYALGDAEGSRGC